LDEFAGQGKVREKVKEKSFVFGRPDCSLTTSAVTMT